MQAWHWSFARLLLDLVAALCSGFAVGFFLSFFPLADGLILGLSILSIIACLAMVLTQPLCHIHIDEVGNLSFTSQKTKLELALPLGLDFSYHFESWGLISRYSITLAGHELNCSLLSASAFDELICAIEARVGTKVYKL